VGQWASELRLDRSPESSYKTLLYATDLGGLFEELIAHILRDIAESVGNEEMRFEFEA